MLNGLKDLSFSETHAQKRFAAASRVFGEKVVRRIVGFALFLLGAKREEIANSLDMPMGTFLAFLNRASHTGLDAFVDRRRRPEPVTPAITSPLTVTLRTGEDTIDVVLNQHTTLPLPKTDPLGCKVVLLSLLNAKLLTPPQVRDALDLSDRHTRSLKAKLASEGSMALLDQRRGQQQDYRITSEIKAEIVQQFVANSVAGDQTSSERIAQDLQERCGVQVSPRTIRHHVSKLGLQSIRESLVELVTAAKKTPEHDPTRLWGAGAGPGVAPGGIETARAQTSDPQARPVGRGPTGRSRGF